MSGIFNQEAPKDLASYTEDSYLDYSLYVLLDRAIPHLFDGLKPVQRRILFAMHELRLPYTAKPKKSARTVGDVIGKYHPHGDSATYEAMALMAQPFSYRYRLVEGQGNWGSHDEPKSFAAMRYTEAKLTEYTQSLLQDIEANTVDWRENFDASMQEPLQLPARVPNLLLNGSTGIAVGMTTNILPHNLTELVNAVITLINQPEATLEDLLEHIQGPDFPTACQASLTEQEKLEMYRTGMGMIKARCLWSQESDQIIISSLPPQCSGSRCLEQIAVQMEKKNLPTVIDVRDESDHQYPTRLIIQLRSNRVKAGETMSHLFATTDLERSYRVNMNMITADGKPKVLGLLEFLQQWLSFRKGILTRRTQFRLDQVEQRIHALDALLLVFLNLEKVIEIIRTKDDPKPAIGKLLNVDEAQVDVILAMRLRQLAKLKQKELEKERIDLLEEKEGLLSILNDDNKLDSTLISELNADKKRYGDERRTIIDQFSTKAKAIIVPTAREPISVVISKSGWIRCYKERSIDPEKLSFRSGDKMAFTLSGYSTDPIILMTDKGKAFSFQSQHLPDGRGYGEPLSKFISLPADEKVVTGTIQHVDEYCALVSSLGRGFACKVGSMVSMTKNGKVVFSTDLESDQIFMGAMPWDYAQLCLATKKGKLLILSRHQLALRTSGKGTKLINLKKDDELVGLACKHPLDVLNVHVGRKKLKLDEDATELYEEKRGKSGKLLPKGYQKVAKLSVLVNKTKRETYVPVAIDTKLEDDDDIAFTNAADTGQEVNQNLEVSDLSEGSQPDHTAIEQQSSAPKQGQEQEQETQVEVDVPSKDLQAAQKPQDDNNANSAERVQPVTDNKVADKKPTKPAAVKPVQNSLFDDSSSDQ